MTIKKRKLLRIGLISPLLLVAPMTISSKSDAKVDTLDKDHKYNINLIKKTFFTWRNSSNHHLESSNANDIIDDHMVFRSTVGEKITNFILNWNAFKGKLKNANIKVKALHYEWNGGHKCWIRIYFTTKVHNYSKNEEIVKIIYPKLSIANREKRKWEINNDQRIVDSVINDDLVFPNANVGLKPSNIQKPKAQIVRGARVSFEEWKANDDDGLIVWKAKITKGAAPKMKSLSGTLEGFFSQNMADKATALVAINALQPDVFNNIYKALDKKRLASHPSNQALKIASLIAKLQTKIPTQQAKALITNDLISFESNNATGTLMIKLDRTLLGGSKTKDIKVTGFQTQAQANANKLVSDILAAKSNNYSVKVLPNKQHETATIAAREINSAASLKTYAGIDLTNVTNISNGATFRALANKNSVIVTINVAKATNPKITYTITNFTSQTAARANEHQKFNEAAIKNWTPGTPTKNTTKLPSTLGLVENGTTLTSITGLTLPALQGEAKVAIISTPNDGDGKLLLSIIINTPDASNPVSIAISKEITGFQTTSGQAKIDINDAKIAINKLNNTPSTHATKKTTLPSTLKEANTPAEFGFTNPSLPPGVDVAYQFKAADDTTGEVTVEANISKASGTIVKTNFVLTGFQTQVAADKATALAAINALQPDVFNNIYKALDKKRLASHPSNQALKIATLIAKLQTKIPTQQAKALITNDLISFESNNATGTLMIKLDRTLLGGSKTKDIKVTGFQTQAQANANKLVSDILAAKSNNYSVKVLPNKQHETATIAAREINSAASLKTYAGIDLTNVTNISNGATFRALANKNSVIVTINVAKATNPKITYTITNFTSQTAARANEHQKFNEAAIKNWTPGTPTKNTTKLPSTLGLVENGTTLTSITGLTLPALQGEAKVAIISTPNDGDGKLLLSIIINTPDASNPVSIAISKEITGFQTTSGQAKIDINDAKIAINKLNNTPSTHATKKTTLPSTLKEANTPAEFGFTNPSLPPGVDVAYQFKAADDTTGEVTVEANISKASGTIVKTNFVLTGFQTQVAADKATALAAINALQPDVFNNIYKALDKKRLASHPSNQALKIASLIAKLQTKIPTQQAKALITNDLISFETNNATGTLMIKLDRTLLGGSKTKDIKVTGFQTQAQANANKLVSDILAAKSNNYSVKVLPNKQHETATIAAREINSAASLKTYAGIDLTNVTNISNGATFRALANKNSVIVTINVAKATNPKITYTITNFTSQTAARANEHQKFNEAAIKNWTPGTPTKNTTKLPSTLGLVENGTTLTSITGLTLPALQGEAKVAIISTPNDGDGKLLLSIIINTPDASNPVSIAISKEITGFQTTSGQAKIDINDAKIAINKLNNTPSTHATKKTTLPSTLKEANTPAEFGFTNPSLPPGVDVAYQFKAADDTTGEVTVEANISKASGTIVKTNFVLTGFQTQVAADKATALAAINALQPDVFNNIYKALDKKRVASHPSNQALKIASLIAKLQTKIPTQQAKALITNDLISFESNNATGTLMIKLDRTLLGGSKTKDIKVTGFQTQAQANANKLVSDILAAKSNNYSVKVLPNKQHETATIAAREINSAASLKTYAGIDLTNVTNISNGATFRALANKNSVIVTINVAKATNPKITYTITNFTSQTAARANEHQKFNEAAIKNWTPGTPTKNTTKLPSKLDSIIDRPTFTTITGLGLPPLRGQATIAMVATPNDVTGKVPISIVVNTPNSSIASKPIDKILSGFSTQEQRSQKILNANKVIEKVKNQIKNDLHNQEVFKSFKNTLPSTLKTETNSIKLGFNSLKVAPEIKVSYKFLEASDVQGKVKIKATINKEHGEAKSIDFILTGYKKGIRKFSRVSIILMSVGTAALLGIIILFFKNLLPRYNKPKK